MGWYFTNGTRDELIRELIEPQNNERVSAEVLKPCSYIRCDLLQRSGHRWGYKPLEESMHPYYYTCPLRYLEMAQVKCADWRKCVCAYHQALKAKRRSAAVTAGSSSLTEPAP